MERDRAWRDGATRIRRRLRARGPPRHPRRVGPPLRRSRPGRSPLEALHQRGRHDLVPVSSVAAPRGSRRARQGYDGSVTRHPRAPRALCCLVVGLAAGFALVAWSVAGSWASDHHRSALKLLGTAFAVGLGLALGALPYLMPSLLTRALRPM